MSLNKKVSPIGLTSGVHGRGQSLAINSIRQEVFSGADQTPTVTRIARLRLASTLTLLYIREYVLRTRGGMRSY